MKRPAWRVTLDVWHALLLREAVGRISRRRAALAWLLIEPAAYIGCTVLLFAALRTRVVGGIDVALWLAAGLLAYFLFRRTATQGAAAIGANRGLFTYRQVQPVDTILTRCVLEAVLMLFVSAILVVALLMLGVRFPLDEPWLVLLSAAGLWLTALGWGLSVSVANVLVPEAGNVLGMLMLPMMVLSGAVFPLTAVPVSWSDWLMLNPVAHGVEVVRAGLSAMYHHAPELSIGYLFGFALALVFLGLALQVRFRFRLVAS
jgi:capsular polysaccharide transport system permease protein